MIQNVVERELIRQLAGNPLLNFPQLSVHRYPFPAYVSDILGLVLEFAIPLIFMIAFLYSAINNIKYIAIEKELQLKEAMKIMGLPS
jgi:ATP-binding cassette subfamily A (ABC1) protein 3